MQTIIRKKGSFQDLQFRIDLSKYDKVGSDIADIIFSVKEDARDNDDALFQKLQSLGEITYTGTTDLIINVKWAAGEYTTFTIDKIYSAGIFIRFNGDAVADERIYDSLGNTLFKLKIEQDFLRA